MTLDKLVLKFQEKDYNVERIEFITLETAYNIYGGRASIEEIDINNLREITKKLPEGILEIKLSVKPLIKLVVRDENGKYTIYIDEKKKVFYMIENSIIPTKVESLIKEVGYNKEEVTRKEFINKIY